MAHRLQVKLGVVPDTDRVADSPDTVLHVEPRIGAQTRTKGHLYLLVTSQIGGRRAAEATRLVADSIRAEYYYDESAGIRVCLGKAIQAANKRLSHARERSTLGSAATDGGPIGVAVAVVRDNELYVATVGPAEAYLARGARLSTLPDPHRERGLPSPDLEPDVWRGEVSVGDQLLLVSPNVTDRVGTDALKDALVTLHPQAAIEDLHRRFMDEGGAGSDGAITLEIAEVAASRSGRAPVPVRPPEPLAGVPDRSPIPLADSVVGGVAAAQSAALAAQSVAGGALEALLHRAQDALPARGPRQGRVRPATARREMQQRAATAVLSIIVVVGVLGAGLYFFAGHSFPGPAIASFEAGQQALADAQADLDRVEGPGIDLVANDPKKAASLLNDAIAKLTAAGSAGIATSTLTPLRAQAVGLVDRLYRMQDVSDETLFTFPSKQPTDLTAIVLGPDGAPFVLDAGTKTVYRLDLAKKTAQTIFHGGSKSNGATEGDPKYLAVGARDLLILDSKSVMWRWRPANSTGRGTLRKLLVNGASEWGSDVKGIGTFLRNREAGLYNLYVVDPSEQQIRAYAPAADGGGFPSLPTGRLTSPRDVSGVTSLYIDGDIWLADDGAILRVANGRTDGWTAADPGDEVVRVAPKYTVVGSGTDARVGQLYGYDPANGRVLAFQKTDGSFVGQFRLADGSTAWDDLRAWYVIAGVGDQPDSLIWISGDAVHRTVLQPVSSGPDGSPEPGASGAGTEGSGGPPASDSGSPHASGPAGP